MKTVTRIVRIEWKNNPSVFELQNKDAFATTSLRLGSAMKPIQQLLARSEELRVIMPNLIGCSPIDPSWQDKCGSYLNDFFMEIPRSGLTMDVSYTVDFGLERTKEALSEYSKSLGNKPTDVNLEDWVVGNITGEYNNGKYKVVEEELYKYVTVTNPADYINWRICLLSAKVANKIEDVNKSVNIEFYLTSEEAVRESKRVKTRLKTDAIKYYTELITSKEESVVNNFIIASGLVTSYEYYKTLTFEDKCAILLDMCNDNPDKFLALKKDSNINMRAKITMYLWYDVLRYINGTSIIVDSHDPEKVIGNTMEEAISYFSNELHKAHTTEMYNRYKSLKDK